MSIPPSPIAPKSAPVLSSTVTHGTTISAQAVLGISLGIILVIIWGGVGGFLLYRRRNRGQAETPVPAHFSGAKRGADISGSQVALDVVDASVHKYKYGEIKQWTGDFAGEALLGAGAFGAVFRATLPDGSILAVKEYKKSREGVGKREFLAELFAIGRVRHPNLVSLRGYCIAESGYYLVMDYAPNGNLQSALFSESSFPLTWHQRLNIAVGIARGLSYLHHLSPAILHRDVKSANILLDEKMDALVADFGLAKLLEEGTTRHSSCASGTYGYVALEYALYGQMTKKCDVYSFGVVLLELLTGRRAVEKLPDGTRSSLVSAIARTAHEPLASRIIDPRLRGNFPTRAAARFLALAVACVSRDVASRPYMPRVQEELESIRQTVEANPSNFEPFASSPLGSGFWSGPLVPQSGHGTRGHTSPTDGSISTTGQWNQGSRSSFESDGRFWV